MGLDVDQRLVDILGSATDAFVPHAHTRLSTVAGDREANFHGI